MNSTVHAHPSEFLQSDPAAAGIRRGVLSCDHRRIGFLYLISITGFALIGMLAAGFMRIEMLTPEGDVFSGSGYGRLFSLHGMMMFYFFALPAIPAVLGNLLLPRMLGVRNLAFPRLNLLGWCLFASGGLLILTVAMLGGLETGWSMIAAYTGTPESAKLGLTALGLIFAGASYILTALNFLATLHTLRGARVGWAKVPVFAWSLYAASVIVLLATPLLITTMAVILAEQVFSMGVFNPLQGGSPDMLRRLFGFFYNPAQYMILLPALGVIGEIISCFSRRGIVGKRIVVYAFMVMAILSLLGGGQQLLADGSSVLSNLTASLFSLLMVVPFMMILGHWLATLYQARTLLEAPMLYALGAVILLTIGICSGLTLSALPLGQYLKSTYFEVGQFHFLMAGGMLMAFLGALHYWWPALTGRQVPAGAARGLALLNLLGVLLTFVPLFIIGYMGLPRRQHTYPESFQVPQVLTSAGSSLLLAALLAVMAVMIWSLVKGKRSEPNPWGSAGLEW